MKILIIILLTALSSCLHSKKGTVVGYQGQRMILVTTDSISYGSKVRGNIGDQYRVLYRGNSIVRVQPVKK